MNSTVLALPEVSRKRISGVQVPSRSVAHNFTAVARFLKHGVLVEIWRSLFQADETQVGEKCVGHLEYLPDREVLLKKAEERCTTTTQRNLQLLKGIAVHKKFQYVVLLVIVSNRHSKKSKFYKIKHSM